MKFSENGTCKKEGYGLYFEGEEGYEIYKSSQVDGAKLLTIRFLAIHKNRVFARKRGWNAAVQACEKHRKDAKNSVNIKRRKPKLRRGF